MPKVQMTLARDLMDVQIEVHGSARPVPLDATGDFLADTVCTLMEPINSQVTMVEMPFARGESAHLPVNMIHLLPG